jgi:PAS domain-containing protein
MKQPIENQTHIILDSIADGVFTVNLEWKITSFNRAAEEITGIKKMRQSEDTAGKFLGQAYAKGLLAEENH